jgi:hypothetical protein
MSIAGERPTSAQAMNAYVTYTYLIAIESKSPWQRVIQELLDLTLAVDLALLTF